MGFRALGIRHVHLTPRLDHFTGWPFKASERILVNRVLWEDIKYPKGLPSFRVQGWGLGPQGLGMSISHLGLTFLGSGLGFRALN